MKTKVKVMTPSIPFVVVMLKKVKTSLKTLLDKYASGFVKNPTKGIIIVIETVSDIEEKNERKSTKSSFFFLLKSSLENIFFANQKKDFFRTSF